MRRALTATLLIVSVVGAQGAEPTLPPLPLGLQATAVYVGALDGQVHSAAASPPVIAGVTSPLGLSAA
jgi:hypothetical protein